MEKNNNCTICDEPLKNEPVCTVRAKGLQCLIGKSEDRKDNKHELWVGKSSVVLHELCRKRYRSNYYKPTVKRVKLELETGPDLSPSLSSSIDQVPNPPSTSIDNSDFDFSKLCFFCNSPLNRYKKLVHTLTKKYALDRLNEIAVSKDDDTSRLILNRLKSIRTPYMIKKIKPKYHDKCHKKFIKKPYEATSRESEAEIQDAIEKIGNYMEESGKFEFSIQELKNVVKDLNFSNYILFSRLKKVYGERIFILQHIGRAPIIYYKTFNLAEICSSWFMDDESMGELEKKTIVHVAGNILRKEIKKTRFETDKYPPPSKFLDNVASDIPPLLNTFLSNLLHIEDDNKVMHVKHENIAHSIVSAICSRNFSSTLQLAIGVYVHRKTGSKQVIELLSRLGICASYYNIQLYEASVIKDPPVMELEQVFIKFVFDNTNHNISTLDGKESLNCLRGILGITSECNVARVGDSKKLRSMPFSSELTSLKQITTVPYGSITKKTLESIEFIDIAKLLVNTNRSVFAPPYAAYIWSKAFKVSKLPFWRGFFEILSKDVNYSVSHTVCLPFINLKQISDLTTLHSALQYAVQETRKIGRKTGFTTFDQPLYYKSRCIKAQNHELKDIEIRLGGFQLLTLYLEASGFIMEGSGLEDLWSNVYAPESVKKIIAAQAFSRALRAHILTYTAIGVIICKSIATKPTYKAYIEKFFENWNTDVNDVPKIGDCNSDVIILQLQELFEKQMELFQKRSPTAKLWIQYFKIITYALKFIEAERIGDWNLHLESVKNMIPVFYAGGYFAYAKCAHIYLQDMATLGERMDEKEFTEFTRDGYFTMQRTDKAWSGVWNDMVIEQTINRFFGKDLKHSRGMKAGLIARYLLAMPFAFNIMEHLENYCGLKSALSDQHVDLSDSRMKRDYEDLEKFVFWFDQHDPFKPGNSLMSVSTGIIGEPNINCHQAIEKGQEGIASIIGKNWNNTSLKNVYKVKPLSAVKNGVHADNENINAIDSSLLFQRICVLLQGNAELTKNAFKYELSPYPLSLFDEQGLMRKPEKSKLYQLFNCYTQYDNLLPTLTKVIDGEWLLHNVSWSHSRTYEEIFETYYLHIERNLTKDCTIIFDGYNNERIGTKSYDKYRSKEKSFTPEVHITYNELVHLTQKQFLSNSANKFKFAQLLSEYLRSRGIYTKFADETADTLIVNTAIELTSIGKSVAIIGNNVDLLILAIALTPASNIVYFHKSDTDGNQVYSTRDHLNIKDLILFAYAFAGCDTTSAIYGKGIRSIIAVLEKNQRLREEILIFNQQNITENQLYELAEKFILHLYNATSFEKTIAELRYRMFASLTPVAQKQLSLATLPPTKTALHLHVKRAYYQIQLWLGNQLNPENWGWERTNFMLLPIKSKEAPAPIELLNQVFCSCQTNCGTAANICSCKKVGLSCTQSCTHCNGQTCENASSSPNIEFEDFENTVLPVENANMNFTEIYEQIYNEFT